MSFAPGWDRRDPRTLRFVNPELEAAFRQATLEPSRRRLRLAMFLTSPVWLLVAILGPPIVGVDDPTPVYLTCGITTVVLVSCGVLTGRVRSRTGLDLLGMAANTIAGLAVVVLVTATATFDRFAAVGMVVTAIVGLNMFRLTFPAAVMLAVIYMTSFTIVALASGTAVAFQVFLVGSGLAFACGGTYLAEAGERQLFSQGRLIADLHRRVDTLFHQYLSPDVAETLLEAPERARLGGEVAEVTVLFADLEDFTPFSERTSPRDVVDMLNGAFGAAVPVIFAEGGTIIQFAGDAVMAIFNAPVRQPDHALRAARAALGLQRAVASIPGPAERPSFRVGLSTGPTLVGNIGSPQLRNFTAIGDTTNLAARLQTFAAVGSVVVSQRTYRLIEPVAEVRLLGAPELKGRTESTAVYELLSLRDEAAVGLGPSA
ncbi:MAG: adenylate/guanylate cyclase domain-containing protein [Candidatus Limnocylindria bacterium]